HFWASWQDDDEPAALEDVELVGAEAAIHWGRARSCTVLIRLGNRGDTYFSAGSRGRWLLHPPPLGFGRCTRSRIGSSPVARTAGRRRVRSTPRSRPKTSQL